MKVVKLGLGAFGVAVAAAVLSFGLLGFGTSSAAPGPGGPGGKRGIFAEYQTVLAQKLGISLQQLQAAEKATRDQLIDNAVAAGKLTKAQGDALKAGQKPPATPGQGQGNRGPGGMRNLLRNARDIFQQHETVLAQKLGISPQQLQTAQKAARDQLIDNAVAAGKLTKAQGDALKSGHKPSGGAGGSRGPGARGALPGGLSNGITDAVKAAAAALNLTPEQLQTSLRGGQSLAELAQSKGIGRDGLRAAIMASVQNDVNAAIRDGKITAQQGTTIIDQVSKGLDRLLDAKLGQRGNNRPPFSRPGG
ncbi:MAG TPA: hypothetical protein VH916_12890, partial [Dehalococcoidia bacterium]